MAADNTEGWREFLEREQRHDLRVRTHQACVSAGSVSQEDVDLHKVNPFTGERPFFVRGLANMLSNDSKQARMLLTPCSECPLRSPRHAGLMIATRGKVERVSHEQLEAIQAKAPGEAAPSGRFQGRQRMERGHDILGVPRNTHAIQSTYGNTKLPRMERSPRKVPYGKLLLAV
mmetsp:Transcript_6568/g.14314  ORF Transcript_6568/g.14314 Transcript_6568/m.14314 type:complete len:174 (+) Transcript_6568:85-606(+)